MKNSKDIRIAKQSLKEEKKAVRDYTKRRKVAKSKSLKKALTHAIPEEREHARLFKKSVKK